MTDEQKQELQKLAAEARKLYDEQLRPMVEKLCEAMLSAGINTGEDAQIEVIGTKAMNLLSTCGCMDAADAFAAQYYATMVFGRLAAGMQESIKDNIDEMYKKGELKGCPRHGPGCGSKGPKVTVIQFDPQNMSIQEAVDLISEGVRKGHSIDFPQHVDEDLKPISEAAQ